MKINPGVKKKVQGTEYLPTVKKRGFLPCILSAASHRIVAAEVTRRLV
jgi:hypothetical protein